MNSKIEEELERSGKILQTTIGDSMEPMLQNRQNIVVIEKADGLLKKYDLPLYRRPNGKYVLHRILKVRKNDYIICGDNRHTQGNCASRMDYRCCLRLLQGKEVYFGKGQKIFALCAYLVRFLLCQSNFAMAEINSCQNKAKAEKKRVTL